MKMISSFVLSLASELLFLADDFIDNRLQVNKPIVLRQSRKRHLGPIDATESLFNEKTVKKLADENVSKRNN